MTCYPSELEYVDEVFAFCSEIVEKKSDQKGRQPCVKQMMSLLNSPLDSFQNIITVLKLENYPKLIPFLSFDNRKHVALNIAKTCLEYPVNIPTADEVTKLFELLQPLIKDEPDQSDKVDEVT
jgi:vacuolar protein sorting-associated protein 35